MNAHLTPSYALTMGSERWTTQVLRVEVALQVAPGINVLRADLSPAASFSAAAGNPAALTLNDGQGETQVFSGSIDSIRQSDTGVHVTALDAGGVLARVRPSATYEHVTPGRVIRALAADAGVQTGRLEDGSELSSYVAHPGLTAWDHIHRVSAWLGAVVSVSASNQVQSVVVPLSGRSTWRFDTAAKSSSWTGWRLCSANPVLRRGRSSWRRFRVGARCAPAAD